MLADPQTVTVNAIAKVMARILTDSKGKTTYATPDGLFTLQISHAISGGKVRTLARLDQKLVVTNPLDSTNDYEFLTTYYVTERPEIGVTGAQVEQQWVGFKTWLDATMIGKLFGREA